MVLLCAFLGNIYSKIVSSSPICHYSPGVVNSRIQWSDKKINVKFDDSISMDLLNKMIEFIYIGSLAFTFQ